jgi:hypothetical protein
MTAEKIQFISKKPDPNIARLEKDAFIIMSEDSIRFNQVSGKVIIGHIFDGKLRTADVNGNAQTIYYLKNKDKYTGVNSMMSSKIYMHLVENKMDTIRFYPKPDGKVIPMKELTPEEKTLKGFTWREKERPKNPADLYPPEDQQKKVLKEKTKAKAESKTSTKEGTQTKKSTKAKVPVKGKKIPSKTVPKKAPVKK